MISFGMRFFLPKTGSDLAKSTSDAASDTAEPSDLAKVIVVDVTHQ